MLEEDELKDFGELISFFHEYEKFFSEFKSAEMDKLQAVTSWDLKGIEKSISVQQANQKRMENLESKRQSIQKAFGMEGLTFKEIIGKSTDEYKQELEALFSKTQAHINEIKFLNDKSMNVVASNIETIGKKLPEEETNPVAREYKAANKDSRWMSHRLEIKI
jgi:hypothetical protein